jgi:hypothetical protein
LLKFRLMHTFLYLLLFTLAGLKTFSQQRYFLYIQSDERQPFYVRMDDKIFSSSEAGYLILGKLEDANYNLLIGFPKNIYPEHQFQISINKKDKGFVLKRVNERAWQLVNLQNQSVINNSAAVAVNTEMSGEKKTDRFSVMLANVVNDSAILYPQNKPQVVPAVAEQKPAEKNTAEKKDTVSVADIEAEALVKKEAAEKSQSTTATPKPDTSQVIVKIKEPTAPTVYEKKQENLPAKEDVKAAADKPFISRLQEERTTTSYKATYLLQYNYTTDTVDILIPAETVSPAKKQEPVLKEAEPVTKETTVITRKNEIVNTDSSRSMVLQIGSVTDTFKVKKKIVILNSDCKNFATENDVDKLRIRLLAEKSIDDKLAAARKYYKSKCFSVQQIRALTELFPTDETKYRYLDLSYAFASDSGNYYLLEEVMTEEYYKNRFKAMIRK